MFAYSCIQSKVFATVALNRMSLLDAFNLMSLLDVDKRFKACVAHDVWLFPMGQVCMRVKVTGQERECVCVCVCVYVLCRP